MIEATGWTIQQIGELTLRQMMSVLSAPGFLQEYARAAEGGATARPKIPVKSLAEAAQYVKRKKVGR